MVDRRRGTELRRLYGRRAEIQALDRSIRATADGRSGVVLVEGLPGWGKTSLIDEADLLARRSGISFLRAAGVSTERATPLAPLLRALSECGVSTLPDLEARLARKSARRPVIVAIDDIHDADDATLVALRTLPGRLSERRILWLLTLAPGRADSTAHALRRTGATTLRLAPLQREAVRELTREVLRSAPSEAVLDLLDDLGGNPSNVVELLGDLVREGIVEISAGRARVTGHGLQRALTELQMGRPSAVANPAELGLTKSEFAVAQLVAQGATNRQAAERLFVSPHTVSTHLRHTFEKLGIRSRVELAILFAGHRQTSTTSPVHVIASPRQHSRLVA